MLLLINLNKNLYPPVNDIHGVLSNTSMILSTSTRSTSISIHKLFSKLVPLGLIFVNESDSEEDMLCRF